VSEPGTPLPNSGDRGPSAAAERRIKMIAIGILIGVALLIAKSLIVVTPEEAGPASENTKTEDTAAVHESADTPEPRARIQRTIAIPDDVTVLDIASSADQLHSDDLGPLDDLLIVQSLVDAYRRVEGANPSGGLNFEIVARLTGSNERKVAFISPAHPDLNDEGELVDRWGTPYWFHPVTREKMEIVSAGPDRSLFTDDDVKLE